MATTTLAGRSGDAAPSPATPTEMGVVHLPTSVPSSRWSGRSRSGRTRSPRSSIGLRSGFAAKGRRPMAALERDVAGYHAMGIVVDQSDQVRDVYCVVAYTEQVHAIRLAYDPSHPEALDVYRAVLDSWSWG